MPLQQPGRLGGAVPDGEEAGQAEGVEAMEVTPRGQDVRGAQQVAAGGRADVAPVQGVEDALELGVLGQETIGVGQFLEEAQVVIVRRHAAHDQGRLGPLAGDQGLDGGPGGPRLMGGFRHRQQHVHALPGGGRLADHVQALGDEGVLQLQHLVVEAGDGGLQGLGVEHLKRRVRTRHRLKPGGPPRRDRTHPLILG